MKIQKYYICIAILLTFCSAACSWNGVEKGPYLQNVGKDNITIMWETLFPTESRVDYGITEECNLFVEYSKEVSLHEITLRPLMPNTRYYYKISYGFTTKAGRFKTAPNHNIPFKFIVYGDSRSGSHTHRKIAENFITVNPDLILHTGDLVDNGKRGYLWESQFFEPLHNVIDHIPIYPCLGNHEKNAKNYFNFFSLPNNESWYSFNYSNCHFAVLDTNKPYGRHSKQYKWLKNDLRETHTRWKFVILHHPPYSSGLHHGSSFKVRRILTPLFRKYGVDIVFCGHSHIYERSYPIGSASKPKQNPVTYVITGGGGGPLYKTKSNVWSALTKSINNFCVVDIDREKLNFRALDINGKVIDRFNIVKQKGKYQQYVKSSIPYEQIEFKKFEKEFPKGISSPIVHLEKGKRRVQGTVKIKNPFSTLINVKILWHHLNGWNVKPKRQAVKIRGKKTARIPFTFRSPPLNRIWPLPKFSIIYATGFGTLREVKRTAGKEVTGNHLRVIFPREMSCGKTSISPEIDGQLREQFWTQASRLNGRVASTAQRFIRSDSSDLAEKQTIAKVVRGEDAVYFALVCNDPEPENLSADVNERDGAIRDDESVIVSIVPRKDKIIYKFGVNCDGVKYDAKGRYKEWSARWHSATSINDDGWTVEMSVPYSVLELFSPPKKGEMWKINFFRSTRKPAEKSEWSVTLNSPHTSERMGVLVMN